MSTNITNLQEQNLIPFSQFEKYLQSLGLPFEGIIASEKERNTMASILPQTFEALTPEVKKEAVYLSKFVASSAIGLYDAGLNYIWSQQPTT